MLKFEWNQVKASQNSKKHGISFEEAKSVALFRRRPIYHAWHEQQKPNLNCMSLRTTIRRHYTDYLSPSGNF